MTAPRSPGTSCSLVEGAGACYCASDSRFLSDREVAARAAEMLRWQQRATPAGRLAARDGLDALLDAVRERRRAHRLLGELLRAALLVRMISVDSGDRADRVERATVEALLVEFSELAEHDGDPRLLGEAATMRAHRTCVFGQGEDALADAAAALAILTEIAEPRPGDDPAEWAQGLSRALNGLLLVLLKLGSHEFADEVSQRAIAVSERGGSPMDGLVHQLNRVRLQLSWALRLERGGRDAAAATRFVGAAQTAHAAARLWGPAQGLPAPDVARATRECSIIGAAFALSRPGPEHLEMLQRLVPVAHFTEDRIMLAIAASRCLMVDNRPADAAARLAPLRAELEGTTSEALLTLALHREFARVHAVARGALAPPEAIQRYAAALEAELWELREARLTALRSHSAHDRLAREHGAVTAQAMQDPLTGLPNRRALDLRLAEATTCAAAQPCAVALIDLDHFKDVNDAQSHAAGDMVLREVASCLRTVLRAHDLVARYGGDEFVVVLPGTPLRVAHSALQRAAEALAALPPELVSGVTMSVGVVAAPLGSDPGAALSAADALMYRAKRAGGNTVVSEGPARGERIGSAEVTAQLPAARAAGDDGPAAPGRNRHAGPAGRVRSPLTSSAVARPPE